MFRNVWVAWGSVLLCMILLGCGKKVNKIPKDVHQYRDLNQELEASQNKVTATDFKEKIGDELRTKIVEFEKYFDVEIKYVAKGCLSKNLKEQQVLKSFDYILRNLKYPKFSKQKNVVLGCGLYDLGAHYRPGYHGQISELNHIWVREYYDNYASNDSLIVDNSYDPYAEPIIMSYIDTNIATMDSTVVKSNLPFDSKILALGCKAFKFKKVRTYDYDGLKQFLDLNKGELFSDYDIPALLEDPVETKTYLFSIYTKEGRKIPYRLGSSSVSFDILLDPMKPAVLGNVLSKVNYATCSVENSGFRISLDIYKFNGSGKIYELGEQTIGFDIEGKFKSEVKSEPLSPVDNFSELLGSVSAADRLLPNENFDFDTRYSPTASIRVGVLDTGVDYNHPALFWRILREAGKMVGFDGYDLANHFPFDHVSHGTHVSGISVKGSQKLALVPLRMNIFTEEDTFLELIDSAVNSGVRVINVSLGWFSRSQGEQIFKGLIKGIQKYPNLIFVIAAGNESANLNVTPIMPACLNADNTIVVAAIDDKSEISDFSNYGRDCVDVAAPGVDILSSVPGKSYRETKKPSFEKMSGTSMAAPFVTNVSAKLLSLNSSLTPKQVKSILTETSFKTLNLENAVKASGYVFPDGAFKKVKNEQ